MPSEVIIIVIVLMFLGVTHVFSISCIPGTHKNRVLPRHLYNRLGESPCAPMDLSLCLRSHVYTENTIWHFVAFENETKSNFISRKERKSGEDPQENWEPKKPAFSSTFLKNLHGNLCVNQKPHEVQNMFGCTWTFAQFKPSQAFVHSATNFKESALVQ